MAPLELFWISGSPPSWRVMLALEIQRIDYLSHQLDAGDREHKSPEFLALNPRGQVPVLRHGEVVVRESLAIIAYLDRLNPSLSLFGDDPRSTAAIWQWVMDFENHLRPALATIAQAIFRDRVAEQLNEIELAAAIVRTELTAIDRHLSNQAYLCGNSLTACDIVLYPSLQWCRRALAKMPTLAVIQELADLLSECHNAMRWEGAISSLPGYEKTYPPHWR